MKTSITLPDAVALCRAVESVVAPLGYHTALTGGCLYKDGVRKDADIMLYPHDIKAAPRPPSELVDAPVAAGIFDTDFDAPASTTDKVVWVGRGLLSAGRRARVDLFFL